jgi:predicted ATP-grasp superfamily ATP-dependent carboligase
LAGVQSAAVLVLGADSPIGLTVVRELGRHGVPVIAHGRSERALGRFSRFSTQFTLNAAPITTWLPDFVRDNRVAAIMAITEGHLIDLSKMGRDVAGARILTPNAQQLAMVLDKPRTLAVARDLGIDVPSDWQPHAGEDRAERLGALTYPVAIKWADPNAVQPMLQAAGLAFEKVEYANSAASLAEILERYDGMGQWPLVQQYCPGYGLGQMLHMHGGQATLRFQHRRLREFPPSGGVSSFCTSLAPDDHQAQMALSEALLNALGWEGPAMVEYRFDPATGRYWLMEINGRFWGSMPLASHCGAYFAWETYRCAMGESAAAGATPAKPARVRQRRARYVIPDAKHIALVVRDRQRPISGRLRAVAAFVADFVDPRVRYYVWSLRDPRPFFGDMWGIISRIWR